MCFVFWNYPVSSKKIIFCCSFRTGGEGPGKHGGDVPLPQEKSVCFPCWPPLPATSEISPGLMPWRRGACTTERRCPSSHLYPSMSTRWLDPAQTILNLGFLLPCLERTSNTFKGAQKRGSVVSVVSVAQLFSDSFERAQAWLAPTVSGGFLTLAQDLT